MAEGKTIVNVELTEIVPRSPSNEGLSPTDSEQNTGNDQPLIDEGEDSPITAGPAELPITALTVAPEQEPKENIWDRLDRKVCVLCIVTFVLVAIVVGLSIHASQIRQSQITSERNYEILNSNVSILEKRLRDVEGTKSEVCQFLKSSREQACSQDWIRSEDRCYFISRFKRSYDGAKQYCSDSDSKLLDINSNEEENLLSKAVRELYVAYWIGKCRNGKPDANIVYTVTFRKFNCNTCTPRSLQRYINDQRHFICEKSIPFCPDIPEKIQDLCKDTAVSTGTK